MLQNKFIEEITAKLSELAAHSPLKDFEKNSRAMLSSMFAKMDLVTREEFDVQSQVLLRTREKLAELEAKLAALEKSSSASQGRSKCDSLDPTAYISPSILKASS